MKYSFLLLLMGFVLFLSCGESEPKQNTPAVRETPVEPEPQVDPTEELRAQALASLEAYYTALEAEEINVADHFAPEVEQFFGSRYVAREQVEVSLRQGFTRVEDRSLTINPASLELTETDQGYEVVFSGTSRSTSTEDGETTETPFSNRVIFNRSWKMVSYTAAQQNARKVPMATRGLSEGDLLETAKRTLAGFHEGDLASLEDLVHPEMGLYLIVHPGAMSFVYPHMRLQNLTENAPWLGEGLSSLKLEPTQAPIPDFDCANLFAQEGLFLDENPGEYESISNLMSSLNQIENGLYESADIAAAKQLERYVQAEMVDTDVSMGFLFGQIQGKWYLLVVDMASYDCSA